jgi:hypothetical protein
MGDDEMGTVHVRTSQQREMLSWNSAGLLLQKRCSGDGESVVRGPF